MNSWQQTWARRQPLVVARRKWAGWYHNLMFDGRSQTVRIEDLDGHGLEKEREAVLDVYRQAFSLAPYYKMEADVAAFSAVLGRHSQHDGFRFLAARQVETGEIVGFGYGYTSQPGQWWHTLVRSAMQPSEAERWLDDAFELAELAVRPAAQGNKTGSLLHDQLLARQTHRTAVLSTMQTETTGLALYRKRGWVTLLDDFYFPNTPQAYLILGLDMGLFQPSEA